MKSSIKQLLLAMAVCCFAMGCNNEEGSSTNSDYASIYPGVVLYNSMVIQQTVAMDGADVAIKLALLIDECEGDVSKINEQVVEIFGNKYRLKSLLFGAGNTLTFDEETGDWLVTYHGIERGGFDTFLRRGSYRVQSHNLRLSESSAEQPWVVKPEGEVRLSFNNGTTTQAVVVSALESHLYHANPEIRIRVEECAAAFESSKEFRSNWSAEMHFLGTNSWEDMGFTTHFEDRFTLYGEAHGETFYAFDNKHCTEMSYRVEAATPLTYCPSKSGTAEILSGKEVVTLTDPADYPSEDYPSNSVSVERKANESMSEITTTVSYDGLSVTM